ncbi:MAG: DUF1592 domain-containing protein, partial [Gammaproteobacteria bacterium]
MQGKSFITATTAIIAAAAVGSAVLYYRGLQQPRQRWAMLDTYCTDCHNDIDRAGELTFEGLSPESIPEHAAAFEQVVRKLRGRLMPPPGRPQPEQTELDELVAWIEDTIDESPDESAGFVRAQRLTRDEYAHAVEGLLGVSIDAAEYLPTEIEVDGFTNIASALSVSPTFIEQYVNVASTVAHLAVGEPQPKVSTAYFPPPATDQRAYIRGMPLGTRGGIRFEHNFPADGEYRLTVTNIGSGLYPRALETPHTLVVLVDRHEQFRVSIGGAEDLALVNRGGAPARAELMARLAGIPIQVTAGPHEVVITFIERARAASDEHISGYAPSRSFSYRGAPRVPSIAGGIDMIGPFASPGVSRTRSRELLFVCAPEVPERERACAEQITANLARRAFRRPVDDSDLERLMPFFEQGRAASGTFDGGIELMTTAVLASPDFLYRTVAPPADESVDRHALSDLEIASRLAFFLWSRGPDEALLQLAEAGRLSEPGVLQSQVQRMLSDARAEVLVSGFAMPWLDVDDLKSVEPDVQLFRFEFTESLRSDFSTEIEMFIRSVLLSDADVRTLLSADYTYLNERLARHYGIDGIVGPQFRRVELENEVRHGLLGKGAVLLSTSYGDRTSPVLRGAWVLEKLMGTPPAPPPPGVETDLTTPEGEQPRTIRARLEQHRESPSCNGCHGVIDPYGLALENFNVLGTWRTVDRQADAAIDASTQLPGGRSITGPVELRNALLSRSDQFVQALTEKLMMYALGRELEHFDMPAVRAIVRDAADNGYRFSAIVSGIVSSDAFRMQSVPHEESPSLQ